MPENDLKSASGERDERFSRTGVICPYDQGRGHRLQVMSFSSTNARTLRTVLV